MATDHGREFVGRVLREMSLNDGIDEAIEMLQMYYRGKAANALVAALKDLDLQYQQIRFTEKSNG